MIGRHHAQVGKAPRIGDGNAVEIGGILIKTVITLFEMNILKNKEAGSHADGQSENIQEGKNLVFEQGPVGGFKVIFQHGWLNLLP